MIEPHDHWKFELQEMRRKYNLRKQEELQEQDECPHDEHEGGYCIECGKDIMDDLIGRAELMEDR